MIDIQMDMTGVFNTKIVDDFRQTLQARLHCLRHWGCHGYFYEIVQAEDKAHTNENGNDVNTRAIVLDEGIGQHDAEDNLRKGKHNDEAFFDRQLIEALI